LLAFFLSLIVGFTTFSFYRFDDCIDAGLLDLTVQCAEKDFQNDDWENFILESIFCGSTVNGDLFAVILYWRLQKGRLAFDGSDIQSFTLKLFRNSIQPRIHILQLCQIIDCTGISFVENPEIIEEMERLVFDATLEPAQTIVGLKAVHRFIQKGKVRTRYHFLRDDSEWNGFCELIFDAR
jgi:hypothetical protein